MLLLVFLSLFSVVAALWFGRTHLSAQEILQGLLLGLSGPGGSDHPLKVIVFDLRLSRVLISFVCGGALATAGAAFQGLLRNPLADPFTIGVASGAAFGASVAIFFGLSGTGFLGLGLLPVAAFIGALATLAAVIALTKLGGGLGKESLILAGIIAATFLSALISLLKSLDEESVSNIVFWIMGSFQGRGWGHLLFALPYMAAGLAMVGAFARELDLLALGDEEAMYLGVDVPRARFFLLIGASLLTAATVAVSGIIGFVGLVFPHMVRMIWGARHTRLLFFSFFVGGTALLWSDVAAKTILPQGEELPVGVITALFGGPFFFAIMRIQGGKWRGP